MPARRQPTPRKKAAAKSQGQAQIVPGPTAGAVVVWAKDDPKSRQAAVQSFADAITSVDQSPQQRATASNVWFNVHSPNTSTRDGYDRSDYEAFREEDSLPRTPKQAMAAGMACYDNVGLVRNVIDLMTDFAVKGIDVEHPSDEAEWFAKEWFRRVRGYETSAKFFKQLFLNNNVVVRRHVGKLPKPQRKKWKLTQADEGADTEYEPDPKPGKNVIPLRYTFLNPLTVDLLDEAMATFVGPQAFKFCVTVPPTVVNKVKNPRTPEDKALVAALPADVVSSIKQGGSKIQLDPDKVSVFYYKRDDWSPWATPFLRSVLPDLQLLQKMKLADLSALDGAISNIRIWKLGDIEAGIYPPASTIQYLAEMLTSNVGGGVMDLVWGPDIDLLETSTQIHQFLGDQKYQPVLNAIFQGLGIPATLNGTGQKPSSGYTNNYMSMKTFAERLEYGRSVLREFWEGELRRVQVAMGHRRPASLVFDSLMTDDANIMKLFMDMADRDLISVETLQEYMGVNPEIEHVRLRKEGRSRENGRMPKKADPFHDGMFEQGLWKILAQTGQYGPSELGLEPREKEEGEVPPAERGAKLTKKYAPPPAAPATPAKPGGKPAASKPKGQPGQGRPQGKKDGEKRKQKVVNPRTKTPTAKAFIADLARAQQQLAEVGRIATPLYLSALGKKTLRELTVEEGEAFEDFRFAALCQFPLDETPTDESLRGLLAQPLTVPVAVSSLYQATLRKHVESYQKAPAVEVARLYMAGAHAALRSSAFQPETTADADADADTDAEADGESA